MLAMLKHMMFLSHLLISFSSFVVALLSLNVMFPYPTIHHRRDGLNDLPLVVMIPTEKLYPVKYMYVLDNKFCT